MESDAFVVMSTDEIERVTKLLEAASWCKTETMELVLCEVIKRHVSPPLFFKKESL